MNQQFLLIYLKTGIGNMIYSVRTAGYYERINASTTAGTD